MAHIIRRQYCYVHKSMTRSTGSELETIMSFKSDSRENARPSKGDIKKTPNGFQQKILFVRTASVYSRAKSHSLLDFRFCVAVTRNNAFRLDSEFRSKYARYPSDSTSFVNRAGRARAMQGAQNLSCCFSS